MQSAFQPAGVARHFDGKSRHGACLREHVAIGRRTCRMSAAAVCCCVAVTAPARGRRAVIACRRGVRAAMPVFRRRVLRRARAQDRRLLHGQRGRTAISRRASAISACSHRALSRRCFYARQRQLRRRGEAAARRLRHRARPRGKPAARPVPIHPSANGRRRRPMSSQGTIRPWPRAAETRRRGSSRPALSR